MPLRRRLLVPVPLVLALAVVGCSGDDGAEDAPRTTTVELSAAAQQGQEVAEAQGCTACHQVSGDEGIGPPWAGLAGSQVELSDGTTVVADEEYLTRSIVDPNAQVVKGYNGIMPERSLDDADVAAIVAYLQELGN